MRTLTVTLVFILLTGCGGGRSGGPDVPSPPDPPDPPVVPPPTPTITTLTTEDLTIPQSGYQSLNNPVFGPVISSPEISFTIPETTVSFNLTLRGTGVNLTPTGFFIASLTGPDGVQPDPYVRHVLSCDEPLCSAYIPRTPNQTLAPGEWRAQLGTFSSTTDGINFRDARLALTTRTGPAPDLAATFAATLRIKPFLTAPSVSLGEMQAILEAFTEVASRNQIAVEVDPVTQIVEPEFAEVSSNFTDKTTAALVAMGDADAVNIFFLERFTGSGGAGRIGIAPGVPGTIGIKGNLNGILINATITQSEIPAVYARTTAEFAFHEMGHLLGLYHTTERNFSAFDVLDDTPQCVDLNGDDFAAAAECPDGLNIMFWSNQFDSEKEPMSPAQQHAVIYSPIAVP